jgi:hypothetical protein
MRAKRRGATLQLAEEVEDRVPNCPSASSLAFLDPDSERRGERLDCLHALDVGTRADAVDSQLASNATRARARLSPRSSRGRSRSSPVQRVRLRLTRGARERCVRSRGVRERGQDIAVAVVREPVARSGE